MANDQELKYKITTQGDPSGAEAVAKSVEKVDKAAKNTTKSAGDVAKQLNQTGEVADKLRGGATVVGQVLSGNLRALGQFPAVLKAIAGAVSTNPLFALGTVAGLVILPALQKIKDGWAASAKAAEEAGKKSAEAMERARTEIAKKGENALAAQLKEIAAAADAARRRVDELANAQIAIADAEEAVALAELDANKDLTEVERLTQKAATRGQFRDRRLGVQTRAIEDAGSVRRMELLDLQGQIPAAESRVETAARRLGAVQSRSPEALRRELEREERRVATLPIERERARRAGASDEELVRFDDDSATATQRVADLARELAEAEVRYTQELEAATGALERATAQRDDLVKKEADLIRRNEAADQSDSTRLSVMRAQTQSTRRVEELQRPEQLREAQEKDKASAQKLTDLRKRDAELSREAEEAESRDDFAAQDKAVAARGALRPQIAALEQTQASLDNVASTVESAPAAPALDVAPLQKSIIVFQGKVIELQQSNQAKISALAKTVENLSAKVDNLSASSQ